MTSTLKMDILDLITRAKAAGTESGPGGCEMSTWDKKPDGSMILTVKFRADK